MEQTASVTQPPLGEFRLRLPGSQRAVSVEITRTGQGASVVWVGRRWAGCLTLAGRFEGRPLGRVALDLLQGAHVARVVPCPSCGRAVTDPAHQAQVAAGTWLCERLRGQP